MVVAAKRIGDVLSLAVPILLITWLATIVNSLRNFSKRPVRSIIIQVMCAVSLSLFFKNLPLITEDLLNHSRLPISPAQKNAIKQYPFQPRVADLHCDALLWAARDVLYSTQHPFTGHPVGHVDVPRLHAGRVSIQVFAAVNSVPRSLNFQLNRRPTRFKDVLFLKTVLERWPLRTWLSPYHRVLYQAARLHSAVQRSKGAMRFVRTRKDIVPANTHDERVHAIFAVEGLSCLEGQLHNVDTFFEQGVRMMGPTHFFDTEVGGSSTGECNCGLSPFGRRVARRMRELNMIMDLAHASSALVEDVLSLPETDRPSLTVSHTGLSSVCPGTRGLSDEHLRKVVQLGGVVGITLFEPALCGGDNIGCFVKCVQHARNVIGSVDGIALGSDWDGTVVTPITAAQTGMLASSLLASGNLSRSDVQRILFDNAYNFFLRTLPAEE